ncbi:hypothetical protein GCM10027423_47900 [Spirosoma arcticum]
MAGMEITITGANLKGVQEVKFGSLTALVKSSETGKVVVACPDFGSVQRVPVSVQTSSGTATGQNFTGAPALVIEKESCIPAGMIPGAFITLKGKNFSKVTQVNFSNTTVASNQFTINDSNGITLKVPANTQSGRIWMVNEYGSSQGVQFDLLTGGDGITTSNIATNVPQLVTSVISDSQFNPSYFYYCMPFRPGSYYSSGFSGGQYIAEKLIKDDRAVVAFKQYSTSSDYQIYYESLEIGGDKWYSYKGYFDTGINGTLKFDYPEIKLMLERNSLNTGYTGSVIIKIKRDFSSLYPGYDLTYVGNVLKTADKDLFDIVAYEVKTGEEIKLCNQKGWVNLDKDFKRILACSNCK